MKKSFLIVLSLATSGCASLGSSDWDSLPGLYGNSRPSYRSSQVPPPIPQGGYGESRIMKHDAYGPGVHMDQYGAPVKVKPY
jgi:hypothetical protein